MKQGSVIPAIVVGLCIIIAAAVFAIVGDLLRTAGDEPASVALTRLQRDLADQGARVGELKATVDELRAANQSLGARIEALEARPVAAPSPVTTQPGPLDWPATMPPQGGQGGAIEGGVDQFGGMAPKEETEGLTDAMQLAKARFNGSVARPRPQVLREILGEPRSAYSQDCQPVTNPRMLKLLETRKIAGFTITMIRPALDSLQTVMDRLKEEEPDIYAAIGTAGALCARFVRGSSSTVSSHAWAAAVDLTLKKNLDRMGDGTTQFGLVILAEAFNDAGWYWGAGYSREDSMHFEVGEDLLRKWVAEGKL